MAEVEETKDKIGDLLSYVHHIGQMNQKPVFTIAEYKQLNYKEHELRDRIGIHHDLDGQEGDSIWLKVDRLQRINPPQLPEELNLWVTVSNNPETSPDVKDKIIKTLPEAQAIEFLEAGDVNVSDIHDPLKQYNDGVKRKDVVFRLDNNEKLKKEVERYIQDAWLSWSVEEKLRRETIHIYDALFSLHQTIEVEAQDEERPLELVWGIGHSKVGL